MARRIINALLVQESDTLVSPNVNVGNMPGVDVADLAHERELSKTQAELDVNIAEIDSIEDLPAALESTGGVKPPEHASSQTEHDNYGHDRAPVDGVEVHDVEVEHVTLEQELLVLGEHARATEEAAQVAVALEELAAISIEPLTTQSRKILRIATESLLTQVGDTGEPVLALEDGEALPPPDAKPEADHGVVEKITSRAKAIWQAIIEAIKKAWAWLKATFRRFFDFAGKIKANAEKIKKELQELVKAGAKTGVTKFTHPRHWKALDALRVGYEFPHDPVHAAQSTHKAIAGQLGRFKADDLYNGKFLELVVAGKEEQIKYDPANEKRVSALVHKGPGSGTVYFEPWASEPLMGNTRIVQNIGHQACQGAAALQLLRETPQLDREVSKPHDVNPYRPKGGYYDVGASKEAPMVTPKVADQLCDEAISMADSVLGFRDLQGKLESLGEKMLKAAEKMLQPGESKVELKVVHVGADWERARRDFLAAGPRIFAHEPASMVNYALSTASALAGYCGEIVKIHKGDESYAKIDTKANSA